MLSTYPGLYSTVTFINCRIDGILKRGWQMIAVGTLETIVLVLTLSLLALLAIAMLLFIKQLMGARSVLPMPPEQQSYAGGTGGYGTAGAFTAGMKGAGSDGVRREIADGTSSGTAGLDASEVLEQFRATLEQEQALPEDQRVLTHILDELRPVTGVAGVDGDASASSDAERQEDSIDDDVKTVLRMTDELLEQLPEKVIAKFTSSKDFTTYERVMKKLL